MDVITRPKNIVIKLSSKQDIDKLYDYCIKQEDERVNIEVESLYDAIDFIRSGFIPLIKIDLDIIIDYVNGVDLGTLVFWYGLSTVKNLTNLIYFKQWQFNKLSFYIKRGVENAESYGLILYAPNKLYSSLRPITDMSIFLGPNNKSVTRTKIFNNRIILNHERWNVIPVTRYAAGMSKGLYNKETKKNFCGTFYYNEPESTTLLAYKTSRTFFNKTHAMMELDPGWDYTGMLKGTPNLFKHMNGRLPSDSRFEQDIELYINGEYSDDYGHFLSENMSQQLPEDLRLTPQEYYVLYPEKYYEQHKVRYNKAFINTLPEIKHYVGKELDLYAEEDEFDQPICILGKQLDIDIIILTHMVGSHQIVTEILDTRDRADSFNSLITIVD